MKVKEICQPAHIYLLFTVANMIMYFIMIIKKTKEFNIPEYNNYSMMGLIIQIGFSYLWYTALISLCDWKPHGEKFAWFLVLLPFIIIGLIIIGLSGGLTYLLLHNDRMKEQDNVLQELKEGYGKKGY